MGNRAQNPLPPNKTDEELAEDFANYFLSQIEKIRESLIDTPSYVALQHSIPKFTSFCPLTCSHNEDEKTNIANSTSFPQAPSSRY